MPVTLRTRLPNARPLPADGPPGRVDELAAPRRCYGARRAVGWTWVAEPCEAVLPLLAAGA